MNALNELVRRAQNGDAASIEVLFSRYDALIARTCGKYGFQKHPDWSRSDLTQEVYLQVWTKIGQFQGVDQPNVGLALEQWIRKTAQSVMINLLDRQNAKKRMPQGGFRTYEEANHELIRNRNRQRTASSMLAKKEDTERIRDAIKTHLDEQGRQILTLRFVTGLSLREISERLSLTYDQVRYKFQSSLAELEKRLD